MTRQKPATTLAAARSTGTAFAWRNKRVLRVLFLLPAALCFGLVLLALAACAPSAPPPPPTVPVPTTTDGRTVETILIQEGFGARSGFWEVYFTSPQGGPREAWVGGIDTALAAAIDRAQGTIDIAAFELDNIVITEALLNASRRGVRIRMVTDDVHGIDAPRSTIPRLQAAGIPVVDDDRSALMHNKFVIIDSQVVWTGAWNYTMTGTYTNNNNALALRSQRAVQAYQSAFNLMFEQGEFGRRPVSSAAQFTQDGIPIQIVFAPEDGVDQVIIREVRQAQTHVRFMAFSFTLDNLRDALLEVAARPGMTVEGVVESRQSTADFAELPPLYCAGVDVRQDGNPGPMHHKVFIIDDHTVLIGSFNFSDSATNSNDENMIIIRDPLLAAQYINEFSRMQAQASYPEGVTCDLPGIRPQPGATSIPEQPTPAPATQPAALCPSLNATCSEMTCQQAYACLAAGNTRLDRDGNGVPCESICN